MIEAISSAVSQSQLVRQVAEQTSTTQSFSANPTKVQAAAVTAPYLSPYIDITGTNGRPIFVVRDSSTGQSIRQFPTEGQIRAYQQAQDQAQISKQVARDNAVQAQAQQSGDLSARSAEIVKSSVEFRQVRQEAKASEQAFVPGQKSSGTKSTTSTSEAKSSPTVTSVDTRV